MSVPLSFQVTSIHGKRIQLRKHALAFLSPLEDAPERLEATLFAPSPTPSPTLMVQVNSESFSWRYAADNSEAVDLLLIGRRGTLEVASGAIGVRGMAQWGDWLGCDQIDLVPVDAEGCVCGDSQSIAHPVPVSMQVAFRYLATKEELLIAPEGLLPPGTLRMTPWRRTQNNDLRRGHQSYEIPPQGIRVAVPQHQGAFVVTSHAGVLVGVQPFAFGAPHDGDEADYLAIQKQHLVLDENILPDWPLWFQTQIVQGLEISPDALVSDERLIEAVRSHSRWKLFDGVLNPARAEWSIEEGLEQFARERWPHFAAMLSERYTDEIRMCAWPLRDSPLLAETMGWIGPAVQYLALCLEWTARRRMAIQMRSFLPEESISSRVTDAFQNTLQALPLWGESARIETETRWRELVRVVDQEFHCSVEDLDSSRVRQSTLLTALHRAADLWDGISNEGLDLDSCLDTTIASLTEARDSKLPGLVNDCVLAHVIPASMIADYPESHVAIVLELRRRLTDPPGEEWTTRCTILNGLLSHPSVVGLIACHVQAKAIGKRMLAQGDKGDERLIAMQREDAALQDWLEYGLTSAKIREEQRQQDILRREQEQRLRMVVPDHFSRLDSLEAEMWVDERLDTLQRDAKVFRAAFQTNFNPVQLRAMEQEILALSAPVATHEDRLTRMSIAAQRIALWMQYEESIHEQLVDLIQAPRVESKDTILRLLRNHEHQAAARLPNLLPRVSDLNRIAELAHFDGDPSFAEEMHALYVAAAELHSRPTSSAVDRLSMAYDTAMRQVNARGGLAPSYEALKEESKRRLSCLEDELHAEGIRDLSPELLDRLMVAFRSTQDADRVEVARILPVSIPLELLQEKFRAHGLVRTLWRSEP